MTESIDLGKAVIVVREEPRPPAEFMATQILVEEMEKGTGIRLDVSTTWPHGRAVIAVITQGAPGVAGQKIPAAREGDEAVGKPEGYRLFLQQDNYNQPIVWIIGNDSRGTLFGAGRLLRTLNLSSESIQLPGPIGISTAPAYPIRGHQLGYRDTANSYDAWGPGQYEQYIRELAIFGANCIENIPFQDRACLHMKIPREEMNIRLSSLCEKYDIDYWLWTPAEFDLSDKVLREAELAKHEELYKACPRVNGIFFPGGDPGGNSPRLVMPFLEDLSGILRAHHPKAGIWLSLQKFNREDVDYFFRYLEEEDPDWLAGVVSGPSSPPIAMTRERLPTKYKLRHYPDITHTIRCQYEVEWWDQAFSLTLGREPCNPQPRYYAHIHNRFAPFTDGFLSYSDGAHDDVNKTIWTVRGWDPEADVRDILLDYCRFFFGPDVAEPATDGILALEDNWVGPLAENESVEATLRLWSDLEERAPGPSDNWRWQLCLLRANYDAYTRRRLIYERQLEREAMGILADVSTLGVEGTMDEILRTVRLAETEPISQDLRKRIEDLCEALFQSIGLQTSVPRYQARGPERGCVLDFVDYPLNNRWWLEDEFAKIRKMEDEEEKKARLEVIRTWEDPGPGSFYDDIGNISMSPHLERGWYPSPGYAWWDGGYSRARLSSQTYLNRPKLRYENLDPKADYTIRVAGYGEALLEVNGKRIKPTVYNREEGQFKEFPVPRRLTKTGAIELTWGRPQEGHLNWRHRSRISDVWLLRG